MTVTIRAATSDDTDDALAVWRGAELARSRLAPSQADERAVAFYTSQFELFVVGDDDGQIVSMAVALPARENDAAGPLIPGVCHIAMLFVDPGRWSTHIGGATLDGLLSRASWAEFREAQGWVQSTNEAALALLQIRGFKPTGRERAEERETLLLVRGPCNSTDSPPQ